jgi:hypothetical protein
MADVSEVLAASIIKALMTEAVSTKPHGAVSQQAVIFILAAVVI